MKKVIKILSIVVFSFILLTNIAKADANVNLTIRDGGTIVFSGSVPLQPSGTTNLNDSNGTTHTLDADSVLSVINDADQLSSDFNISNLIYYDSYNSFYLKCITDSIGNQCDNWQYAVNDTTPSLGMDKNILSGGENIYLYFGQNHKVNLSSSLVTTGDNLTVNAQNYHYQDNTWLPLIGVTIGLTQTDPNNPWAPIEIKTIPVDGNGQATFSSIPIGTYNVGIKEDYYFPTETLNVTAPPDPLPIVYGGGGESIVISQSKNSKVKQTFDIKKAYDFLISQQKEDGSWDKDLYTDWSSLALATSSDYQIQKDKLIKYLTEENTKDYQLTDYERHAIALMALNINPYNVAGENYIEKITKEFDNKQFGDKTNDNDDIFALIVLQNSGFIQNDKMIKNTVDFTISKQKEDGSWDESVDMTGAGIEALSSFKENNIVKDALTKTKEFLKQNQKDDGGFGNISSTTWAMEGILALNEKPEEWIKNNNTPLDYLAINQDTDGGIKDENNDTKIWETAYALSALSGKSWNQIMQRYEKPIIIEEKKTENIKPEIKKNTAKPTNKNQLSKIQNIAKHNIASPIGAINEIKSTEPIQKQNWFRKLINKIFGF